MAEHALAALPYSHVAKVLAHSLRVSLAASCWALVDMTEGWI